MADSLSHVDLMTVLLGVGITILLGCIYYTAAPPSQTHPFLLGRQSTTARTRFPSESPVYTNSSTGGLRAPLRPEKRIRTIKDILASSLTKFEGGERGTWIKGGEKVTEVVEGLRVGLLSTLGSGPGLVAVLVEDPTDALLVILALSLTCHKPLVISPGSDIPDTESVTAVIHAINYLAIAKSLPVTPGARWLSLGGNDEVSTIAQDLLSTGRDLIKGGDVVAVPEQDPNDVALTIVSKGIVLSLSHLNLSASLVSWLALFPASPKNTRPTLNDMLLSFHHPSTPHGFGLALLAIYTNASLSLPPLPTPLTSDSLDALLGSASSPTPTLIFAPSGILAQPLYSLLLSKMMGDAPFIIKRARDGKMRLLRKGILTTSSIWDSLLFGGIRKDSNLTKVRALVLEGPVEQNKSDFFRLALGSPVMSSLEHSFLLAPLSVGGMWDYQRLPPPGIGNESSVELGHVGPPVVGLELKIAGDEKEIAGGRVRGEILIRSPLLPNPTTLPPSLLQSEQSLPQLPAYPSHFNVNHGGSNGKWLRTGVKAEMGREGVLWLD